MYDDTKLIKMNESTVIQPVLPQPTYNLELVPLFYLLTGACVESGYFNNLEL